MITITLVMVFAGKISGVTVRVVIEGDLGAGLFQKGEQCVNHASRMRTISFQ
jgi:hypothetical protein